MTIDHRSVAKIFFVGAGSIEFRGTGFLVTPTHVVSCAHVLFGRDWIGGEEECDPIAHVTLSFGKNPSLDDCRTGTCIGRSKPDLVLIALDKPIFSLRVPLVSGLTSNHKAALAKVQGSVIGFSQTEDKLVECLVQGHVALTLDLCTQQILSSQVAGGLSFGMSGSPLVVELENRAVCLGMAFLGGDGSATSRLIAAETVIGFLERCGVVPEIVQTKDCFPDTQPSDLPDVGLWWKSVWIKTGTVAASVLIFTYTAMDPKRPPEPPKLSGCPVETQAGLLSDDVAHYGISKALHNVHVDTAICQLYQMYPGEGKEDECNHLYAYTKSGGMLDQAGAVVKHCWTGTMMEQEKLNEISTEGIKQ